MKYICLIILTILSTSALSSSNDKSEFIGTWVSDKDVTLKNIKSSGIKLSPETIDKLNFRFGEMAYIFTEKGTTFTFVWMDLEDLPMMNWSVIQNTNDKATIEISGTRIPTTNVIFKKIEKCIGLVSEDHDYIEYFCKQ